MARHRKPIIGRIEKPIIRVTREVISRSKVKVAMSRGASDSCWPISRERKVPETPKLVGKLTTPRAITPSRFDVKRLKFKITRPIKAETESASPTNFKLDRRLEHALLVLSAMANYRPVKVGYCRGIPCRPHPAATQLVIKLVADGNKTSLSHSRVRSDMVAYVEEGYCVY